MSRKATRLQFGENLPSESPKNPVPEVIPGETAKGIYKRMEAARQPYIDRAEEAALYTIPSIFPKAGSNSTTTFVTPYQSLGARGLNNLANQILLAILPPNTPFFRLDIKEDKKRKAEENGVPSIISDIQLQLSQREQSILKYMANRQYSPTVGEGLKQLIVAGNYCFYAPPKEGGLKGYRLSNYVLNRDGLGSIVTLITKDIFTYATLPEDVQKLLTGEHKPDEEQVVYTYVTLKDDRYYSYQEIDGVKIPGHDNNYPKDSLPWIPIRMTKVDGEDYGRGYIEENIGDLRSLEGISKAIVEYAAVCSRIIWLTNPTGMTQPRKLAKAKTGDFVPGRKSDVEALTLDKYNDFRVAKEVQTDLKQDLSFAFLMQNAVQRDAERVTAEEIKVVARQLEQGLGGIYSLLSQELQLPLVRQAIVQMENLRMLEPLPEGYVETSIVTGIEAIGRGQDLDKLDMLLKYIVELEAKGYMKLGGFLKVIITALGINAELNALIKSEEEYQQEIMQQRQMELATKAAPQIAGGAMQMVQNQQQQGGNQ